MNAAGHRGGAHRLVPGECRGASLWVRNDSTTPASVGLGVSDASGAAELLDAVTLEPSNGGAALPLIDAAAGCVETTLQTPLAPGATVRVAIVLAVSPTLRDTAGQDATTSFAVRSSLRETGSPMAYSSACTSGVAVGGFSPISGYGLPTMALTGLSAAGPLALGLGAVLAGSALALRPRRREDSR